MTQRAKEVAENMYQKYILYASVFQWKILQSLMSPKWTFFNERYNTTISYTKKGNVLALGHILVTGFFRRMQKFRHATN